MVNKMDMQKTVPEDFQRQIFENLKELEEQRAKKHKLIKWEGERKRARTMLRRPRLFFFCFLLIVPGLQHRRSNVCFLQDGARGG